MTFDVRARPLREPLFSFAVLVLLIGTAIGAGTTADDAWLLLVRGQAEEAAARAGELLDADPSDARAATVRGAALHRLDQDDTALAEFREREADALEAGAPATAAPATSVRATAALGAGTVRRYRSEIEAADSLLNRAVDLFVESGDRSGEMVAREIRGGMRWRSGRGEAAESDLRTALTLATDDGKATAAIFLRIDLGTFLTATGRYDEAGPMLTEAVELARAASIPHWEGDEELTLGTLWRRQLDFDQSLEHRWAAFDAYERAGALSKQAESLHHIGGIHLRLGEFADALRLYRRALPMAREAGDTSEAAGILADLGVLDYFLGDLDGACQYWEESLADGIEAGRSPDWIRGLQSNLGTALMEQERYEEALEAFERALATEGRDVQRRGEASMLNNLGRCLVRVGRTEEGVRRLEEALEVARAAGDPQTEAVALCDLAAAHLDGGDPEAATAALAEASELARGKGAVLLESEILSATAVVARRRGDSETALDQLRAAIALAEGLRARSPGAAALQTQAFGTRTTVYEEAVDLLFELHTAAPEEGWDVKAFDLAQRAKARAFLDLLAEAGVELRVRADPGFRQREQEILEKVAALTGSDDAAALEIARLEDELALLEIELREADPRYAELTYPEPVTIDVARDRLLGDGDVLLEYLLGDRASYVWVVTRDSFRFVPLPARSEIADALGAMLPMIRDYNVLGADPRYFAPAIQGLSDALLAPVAADLADARRVLVAPHDVLATLPFELLVLGEATGDSWGSLPFLVQRVEVAYGPSVSTLARLAGEGRPGVTGLELLALGDPVTDEESNGSLFLQLARRGDGGNVPAAKQEIATLRALFPGDRSRTLTGTAATVDALRDAGADGARLVHLAVHGVFNESRPQLSGLVLSPDPEHEHDGFLSVLECDQVVLSACSSARGVHRTGEGIEGLTRAFLYAGARSVVSTQWDVAGDPTARFMNLFYGGLGQAPGTRDLGQAPGTHALAEAKRAFLRGEAELAGGLDPAHPYFWAAFVLTGDGG